MPGTRLVLVLLVGLPLGAAVSAGDNGPPGSKPRLDGSRVRLLAEILRTDPDERKRRSAAAELAEADPRVHTEVMPALIGALKKDAAAVRATAAEVIGRFRTVFPLAGEALESAAEVDPSNTVRDAAKQSLWTYHLNGYKSVRDVEGLGTQTAEPPIARPAVARPAVTTEPPTAVSLKPALTTGPLPPIAPPPPVEAVVRAAAFGPRLDLMPGMRGPRSVLALGSVPRAAAPSATAEPPIAKRPGSESLSPTVTVAEPPLPVRWPERITYGAPPPIVLDLPPIVPHPGHIPGTVPFPDPTPEPPLAKPRERA